MSKFKPMLAATCKDAETLKFPVLVSPKLDGIRAIKKDGQLLSRTLKTIPNKHVNKMMADIPDGFDGELIVGEPTGGDIWARTQSGVMRVEGEPNVSFHVFDSFKVPDLPFCVRQLSVVDYVITHPALPLVSVPHFHVHSLDELQEAEQEFVDAGYEGLMVRDPNGRYKFGRSTVREGGLLKVKRWFDAEAVVIGYVEQMKNNNEKTVDKLGHTARSSSKAGKVGKNTLGALKCLLKDGTEFELGTGFTELERQQIWDNRGGCAGQYAKMKYQELSKDGIPRFPVFLGFRHPDDLA